MARETAPFKFKQFDVDQSGCAMKINTDGVLLGALANADDPESILDIGTGTGVIALMLAQRFPGAQIDAVEIDVSAAETAKRNFDNSLFAGRLNLYPAGFEQFFELNPSKKYDLILSNPPFYINSLKSPKENRRLAKHTGPDFFEKLITDASAHLTKDGKLCMILPVDTAELVISLNGQRLYLQKRIHISSFAASLPHRVIVYFGFGDYPEEQGHFVIYQSIGNYSEEYINLLKPYFIAF